MHSVNSLCKVDLPFWQAAEAAAVAVAVAEDPRAGLTKFLFTNSDPLEALEDWR